MSMSPAEARAELKTLYTKADEIEQKYPDGPITNREDKAEVIRLLARDRRPGGASSTRWRRPRSGATASPRGKTSTASPSAPTWAPRARSGRPAVWPAPPRRPVHRQRRLPAAQGPRALQQPAEPHRVHRAPPGGQRPLRLEQAGPRRRDQGPGLLRQRRRRGPGAELRPPRDRGHQPAPHRRHRPAPPRPDQQRHGRVHHRDGVDEQRRPRSRGDGHHRAPPAPSRRACSTSPP